MFKIAVRSLIFWSFLAGTVQAQTISLESFLELVQSNHPFFEKEDILPEIEMKDRESLLGAEDWLITASAHVARLRPASSSAFTPTAVNALGYRIAAERLFWRTGGRLSAGWTYDFTDQNLPPISLPGIGDIPTGSSSFFQHRIFAQYIHPLLQNKKGKLDKLDYELQEFGINLTRIQAQENKENFLLDVARRFLEWAWGLWWNKFWNGYCGLFTSQSRHLCKTNNLLPSPKLSRGLLERRSVWENEISIGPC